MLLWLAVTAVAVLQARVVLGRPDGRRLADLEVYIGSVDALYRDGTLYDFATATGFPFTYPPFAGIVLTPVSWFPARTVEIAWTVLSVAAVVTIAYLVRRALPGGVGGMSAAVRRLGPAAWPALALLLLLSAPVQNNLDFGQISLWLTLLVLVDCLGHGPRWASGVLVGVASAVKLTPLVFVPFLWFAGRRRAAVRATAVFAGCTVLAWLLLPGDSRGYWLGLVGETDRIGVLERLTNQSLNGLLLRLGADGLPLTALYVGLSGAVLIAGWLRSGRLYRDGQPLLATAVAGCAGIVASPVSWGHHLLWIPLAAAGVVGAGSARIARPGAWVWSWTAVAVTLLGSRLHHLTLPGPLDVPPRNAAVLLALLAAAVLPFAARASGVLTAPAAGLAPGAPAAGAAGPVTAGSTAASTTGSIAGSARGPAEGSTPRSAAGPAAASTARTGAGDG